MAAPEREAYLIQIGGRIVETSEPAGGIPDAEITILELGRKTRSNKDGYYTISGLRRGNYEFRADAKEFISKKRKIAIPHPEGNYDIALKPQA